jgi:hypothetical protein
VRGLSDELASTLLPGVVTLMCISQDLWCIWPNDVYAYYDHT